MSDLRTRIAAIIESVGTIDGCCADLAAKAVIRELGMHREVALTGRTNRISDYRYVTDWVHTPDYCNRCGRPHEGKCGRAL